MQVICYNKKWNNVQILGISWGIPCKILPKIYERQTDCVAWLLVYNLRLCCMNYWLRSRIKILLKKQFTYKAWVTLFKQQNTLTIKVFFKWQMLHWQFQVLTVFSSPGFLLTLYRANEWAPIDLSGQVKATRESMAWRPDLLLLLEEGLLIYCNWPEISIKVSYNEVWHPETTS